MRISTLELDKRLAQLEARAAKRQYLITAIIGGALLKRDLATNEITYIDLYDDEYETLHLRIGQVLLVDMFPLESWEPIPDSTDDDDRQGIKNNPEKCWILEHMYPGMTARQAWRKEVREYKEYMAEYERRDKLDARPISSSSHDTFPEADLSQHKLPQVKAYDKAKAETEEEHLRKVAQTRRDIEEEFGNGHIETLF